MNLCTKWQNFAVKHRISDILWWENFPAQGQMCRIVWPLLWTMERLSTLAKANCNNVWSMKLDIFSEWMSYGEIGDFKLWQVFYTNPSNFRHIMWYKFALSHDYAFFSCGSEKMAIVNHFWGSWKWPYLTFWPWNLTLKVICRYGKRVWLRPWTMLILSSMIANL